MRASILAGIFGIIIGLVTSGAVLFRAVTCFTGNSFQSPP
jgi:hypothetical protein